MDENGNRMVEDVPFKETWTAMESLVDEGFVKSIGVSNFSVAEIEEVLSFARIKPVTNQVECHPFFNQKPMRQYLESKGMFLTAYSPLGNLNPADPSVLSPLKHEAILQLAKKYNKSPSQILIRWSIQ
eukprot:Colp12_sorted_trinity150504_noHs@23703